MNICSPIGYFDDPVCGFESAHMYRANDYRILRLSPCFSFDLMPDGMICNSPYFGCNACVENSELMEENRNWETLCGFQYAVFNHSGNIRPGSNPWDNFAIASNFGTCDALQYHLQNGPDIINIKMIFTNHKILKDRCAP